MFWPKISIACHQTFARAGSGDETRAVYGTKVDGEIRCFVDLVNVEDIADGDILTVVLEPSNSPQKVSV